MTLITSISGIRGTIGGISGDSLTPLDIVRFTSAYAQWVKSSLQKQNPVIVLGRDARLSGEMVENIVAGTLMGMGVDVIKLGLATTPTVEMAVTSLGCDGGIILTASHNPRQWNALKLLNFRGEFLSATDGEALLKLVQTDSYSFAEVDALGSMKSHSGINEYHIDQVLELPLVNTNLIRNAGFKVVIDCVNSVGGVIIPELLRVLGVSEVIELNCKPDGNFSHNPEPLPENLTDISELVRTSKADLGFVVDPDVDRLAIVCEDGSMFGEEYTLVAVSDYILSKTPGNTCSNLSSSRALKYITEQHGCTYFAAAVGEVNVVEKMKAENCIIGGEGNGGVIYPELHYGRDALVGIALFLTHLAERKLKCSELRDEYPRLEMVKHKIDLQEGSEVDKILEQLQYSYSGEKITTIDGLKIDFEQGWVHLRKSNTEPIIRVYSEAGSLDEAKILVQDILDRMKNSTD